MDSTTLPVLNIALLILLWLMILFSLNALRIDANRASGKKSRKSKKGAATASATSASAAPAPKKRSKPHELEVVEGPLAGSHMDVSQLESVVMGRNQDCDFILGDDYASSRHARLFRRGSDWFIEDLESRNGTFLSGYRIDQPERIGVGDEVKMGRTTVRLIP